MAGDRASDMATDKASDLAFSIRAIEHQDRKQWELLWQGYNAFYGRTDETALDTAIVEASWQRFFDEAEPVHALVAHRGGELLGIVHFLYHRAMIQIEPVCYLADLFTAEQARGQGVGKALIEAVYQHAKLCKVSYVYWRTHENNATARRLYEQVASYSGSVVYHQFL
jgi:GNAT superfamily N-acetyltransferase